MSLRTNKAARLNRYMMFGMLFLGIIVLGCVFAFLYLSFNPSFGGTQEESSPVLQPQGGGTATDSIIFIVNDSTLLEE
ncbi:MAG: hypothetical protein IJP82_00035 [Bacteroidaceae bacterium]|nr:hypothetical protein [Bacteroidaceae bacterium]